MTKNTNRIIRYSKTPFQVSILLIIMILLNSCNQHTNEQSLVLYCAAGIKPPIEKLAKDYEQKFGVRIDIQYGGSGTLLSSLRISNTGDLFLAADESYILEAEKLGLVGETQPLAEISPVIAVKKGNLKKIFGLDDFLRDDVLFSLGNPGAASIGKYTKQILEEHNRWEEIREKVTVLKPTVSDVANDIRIGSVDAGIIWDAMINQWDDLEMVPSELFKNYSKKVTLGVLNSSRQPTEALKFLRYVSSLEFGNPEFGRTGYKLVKGDHWEEKPTILLYSGGVNRIAIEPTIQSFEKREGIRIERVYNGCGILVSQIKAGQRPDAYLTCDITFMDQVQEHFVDVENVSNTLILIAVKSGNPKNVTGLQDLLKEDMRIGVCNPQQSALGALVKKLLEGKGIWDELQPNIYSQTPTADLLVNQLRTGSLDAVIVYEANVAQVRDKVTTIAINDPLAIALQNFGIGRNTSHYWLLSRLFKNLTAESSKENYLNNGFHWEYNSDLIAKE